MCFKLQTFDESYVHVNGVWSEREMVNGAGPEEKSERVVSLAINVQ